MPQETVPKRRSVLGQWFWVGHFQDEEEAKGHGCERGLANRALPCRFRMKRAVFRELVPWAIVSIMAAWHLADKQGILTSQEAMHASDERPTGPGPDLRVRQEVFDRLLLQHEAAQQRLSEQLRLCATQLEAMRAMAGSASAEGGSSLPSHPLAVEALNRSSGGSLDVTAGPLGYVNTSINTPGAMPTRLPTFSRRCEVAVCIFCSV